MQVVGSHEPIGQWDVHRGVPLSMEKGANSKVFLFLYLFLLYCALCMGEGGASRYCFVFYFILK